MGSSSGLGDCARPKYRRPPTVVLAADSAVWIAVRPALDPHAVGEARFPLPGRDTRVNADGVTQQPSLPEAFAEGDGNRLV